MNEAGSRSERLQLGCSGKASVSRVQMWLSAGQRVRRSRLSVSRQARRAHWQAHCCAASLAVRSGRGSYRVSTHGHLWHGMLRGRWESRARLQALLAPPPYPVEVKSIMTTIFRRVDVVSIPPWNHIEIAEVDRRDRIGREGWQENGPAAKKADHRGPQRRLETPRLASLGAT